MKKQLLASLLSLLFVVGFAPMASAANSASCCAGSGACTMDKASSCAYKVLNKEECERFCKARAAAIKKDPSLAKPENRRKLCRAIVKADPSMKPICMKLRKHCRMMKKDAADSSSTEAASKKTLSSQESSKSSCCKESANNSSPSQQSTGASDGSSVNSADTAPSESSTPQSSSSGNAN